MSEFRAKAPQATATDGLAQGPYVAARAGSEPATLRTKGSESINEPPLPTMYIYVVINAACFVRCAIWKFMSVLSRIFLEHCFIIHASSQNIYIRCTRQR